LKGLILDGTIFDPENEVARFVQDILKVGKLGEEIISGHGSALLLLDLLNVIKEQLVRKGNACLDQKFYRWVLDFNLVKDGRYFSCGQEH
jgi:hypothetical protein